MSREEEFDFLFKIVIIGDSGVGKTNLLSKFIDDTFLMDSKPTIGVEFATKTLTIQNKIIKNQIWDTAGQERFRAITNAYYRGAHGAIIVYDLTKYKTFENINKWLAELKENADPDITMMLLGNKSDLEERCIKMDQVEDFIQENKLLYLETSAKTGDNVNEAFQNLVKEIYEKVKTVPEEKKIQTPTITTQSQERKKDEVKVPEPFPQKDPIKLEKRKDKKKPQKKGCC